MNKWVLSVDFFFCFVLDMNVIPQLVSRRLVHSKSTREGCFFLSSCFFSLISVVAD